jgi:hypothetical protein
LHLRLLAIGKCCHHEVKRAAFEAPEAKKTKNPSKNEISLEEKTKLEWNGRTARRRKLEVI